MTTRTYAFDFYQCNTFNASSNAVPMTSFDIFNLMFANFNNGDSNVKQISSSSYELRLLEATDYGFRGVIGKHRKNDLPHVAIFGGDERSIDLAPNENLLEKAYFTYYSDYSVLILQRNFYCISSKTFGKYLTKSGYITTLNPIIEATDLKWLMDNHVQIRTAEFIIARPTNPDLFQGVEHDFNNSIIATLNGTGTANINMTLRGNARSDVSEERYLASTLKGALRELQTTFDVKKCQLLLENDETFITHPVDLVANRLIYKKPINVDGRYPPSAEMWTAIKEARVEKETDLANYFGGLDQERLN